MPAQEPALNRRRPANARWPAGDAQPARPGQSLQLTQPRHHRINDSAKVVAVQRALGHPGRQFRFRQTHHHLQGDHGQRDAGQSRKRPGCR